MILFYLIAKAVFVIVGAVFLLTASPYYSDRIREIAPARRLSYAISGLFAFSLAFFPATPLMLFLFVATVLADSLERLTRGVRR